MNWLKMFGRTDSGTKTPRSNRTSSSRRRRITLETLESRQLLAVNPMNPVANTDVYYLPAGSTVVAADLNESGQPIYGLLANDSLYDPNANPAHQLRIVCDSLTDPSDPGSTPIHIGRSFQGEKYAAFNPDFNWNFTVTSDGWFEYKAVPTFTGYDSFTYTVEEYYVDEITGQDVVVGQSIGTVIINVGATISNPIAQDDFYSCDQGMLYDTGFGKTKAYRVEKKDGVLENDYSLAGAIVGNDINDTHESLWVDPSFIQIYGTDPGLRTQHGTIWFDGGHNHSNGGNGAFWYEPDPGFSGVDWFTYFAIDQNTPLEPASNSAQIVLFVNPATLIEDHYSTKVGETLEITQPEFGVLANDHLTNIRPGEENGRIENLVVEEVTSGATARGGTHTMHADGTFTYTPAVGFTGVDWFEYNVYNVTTNSFGEEVSIWVETSYVFITTTMEMMPVAVGDVFSTFIGEELVINTDTLPRNDILLGSVTDFEFDTTTLQGGTVTFDPATRELTYTPAPGSTFIGHDHFMYRIMDSTGKWSNWATVLVDILPLTAKAPQARTDVFSVVTGDSLGTSGFRNILTNDVSPTGTTLVATPVTDGVSQYGTYTINADGTFTYAPNAGFVGVDSFHYTATDSSGISTVGTIIINVLSTAGIAPIAVADNYSTKVGTDLMVGPWGVLANDYSPTGLNLRADADPSTPITTEAGGSVTLYLDGAFVYTPAPGFIGTDTFQYRAIDENDNYSNWATVSILVLGSTAANPIAIADNFSMIAGQGASKTFTELDLLWNDLYMTGLGMSVDHVWPTTHEGGTVVDNGNGTYTYTPKAGFIGVDTFVYKAKDTEGNLSNWATVSVVVQGANVSRPDAIGDLYSVMKGKSLTVAMNHGLLVNDSSKTGLDIRVWTGPASPATVTVYSEAGAEVVINRNGSFTYTPALGSTFIGLDSFNYRIIDAAGNVSAWAKVAVNVISPNLVAPEAKTDYYTVVTDKTLNITDPEKGVLANDASLTGSPLQIEPNGMDPEGNPCQVTTTTEGRTVYIYEDGTFSVSYAGSNFVGNDMFQYVVTDGFNSSIGVAVVTVVDRGSVEPIANMDFFVTEQNVPIRITAGQMLANDKSPTSSGLRITNVYGLEGEGTLTPTYVDGNLVDVFYTPPVDFVGNVTFRYTVTDDQGYSSDVVVVITVNAKVQAKAYDDAFSVLKNSKATDPRNLLDVLANDYLPTGDWTIISTTPAIGTVKITDDGRMVTYQPLAGWVGQDVFTYTAKDSISGDTVTARVTVYVNDAPVIVTLEDKYTASAGGLFGKLVVSDACGVLYNDTAADGISDPLTTLTIYEPTKIIRTSQGGYVFWTVDDNGEYHGSFEYYSNGFTGTDTFYYQATDAEGNISVRTLVTIQVANQEGTSGDDYYRVLMNDTLVVNAADGNGPLANDWMVDGNALGTTYGLSFELVRGPQYGTLVSWDADGSFEYVASGNSRTDNFTYRAYTTLDNGSIIYGNLAQVWIEIYSKCPQQIDSTNYWVDWQDTKLYTGSSMDKKHESLLNNWIVPSGNSLEIYDLVKGRALEDGEKVTYPTKEGGVVTIYANGTFNYTPREGFIGWDSFDYRVTDGWCETLATARVVVNPVIYVTCGGVTVSQDDALLQVIDAKKNSLLKVDMRGDAGITGLMVISNFRNTTFTIDTSGDYRYFGSDLWLRDGIYLDSQVAGKSTDKVVMKGSSDADTYRLSSRDECTTNGERISTLLGGGYAVGYSAINGTHIYTRDIEDATLSGGYGDDRYVVAGIPSQFTKTTIDAGKNNSTVDFSLSDRGVNVNLSKTSAQSVFGAGSGSLTMKGNILGLVGSEYNDTLTGNRLDNTIWGLGGNDVIIGTAGSNVIFAGEGNNTVTGGTGNDLIFGGTGNDTIIDNGGKNVLIGGGGSNSLSGKGSNVLVSGTTTMEQSRDAFAAVMATWTSTKKIDERVAEVTRILQPTLTATGAGSTLTGGGSGNHLFFYEVGKDIIQGFNASKDFVRDITGSSSFDITVTGTLQTKKKVSLTGLPTAQMTVTTWAWEIYAPGNDDLLIPQYMSYAPGKPMAGKQSFTFTPQHGAGTYKVKLIAVVGGLTQEIWKEINILP